MGLPQRRSEPCLDCRKLEKIPGDRKMGERWGHDLYAFVGCSLIKNSTLWMMMDEFNFFFYIPAYPMVQKIVCQSP